MRKIKSLIKKYGLVALLVFLLVLCHTGQLSVLIAKGKSMLGMGRSPAGN